MLIQTHTQTHPAHTREGYTPSSYRERPLKAPSLQIRSLRIWGAWRDSSHTTAFKYICLLTISIANVISLLE